MDRVTCLALCLLLVSGCQSLRDVQVTTDPNPFGDLRRGDDVVLTMRDGGVLEIEVGGIEPTAIVDHKGNRFEAENIASVRVERFDGGRTSVLIVACAAAAAVGAAVLQALAPVLAW